MVASTLILLPVLLLLISTLAIITLRRLWSGFAFSWLVAIIGSTSAWAVLFGLRFHLPQKLELAHWHPTEIFDSSPALWLDEISWPYAIALATLAVAVILTATARYHVQASPGAWASSLGLTAIGLLAVLAANPLSILLFWTAIDLVELVILLLSVQPNQNGTRPMIAFTARTIGSMLVLWAMIANRGLGSLPEFAAIPSPLGLFFLLGVGLRLGVFPLHLPYAQEPLLRRGVGTVLRLVPVASGLVVLARLSPASIHPDWIPYLVVLAALAALYGSFLWATATDELSARPFWIISLAAIAITCVLRDRSTSSIAWGLSMILPGGLLFLYTARHIRLVLLPTIAIWGVSGLPFSPGASGWEGLTGNPLSGLSLVFILSIFFLVIGFYRFAFRSGESLAGMERWVHLTYPAGLVLLMITYVFLGIYGWSGSWTMGGIWASGSVSILAILAGFLLWRRKKTATGIEELQWISHPLVANIHNKFVRISSLDWVYRILWALYRGIGHLTASITTVLEGEGGVLWALLLLTLLLSLLSSNGVN
jgi:hypothetical protein